MRDKTRPEENDIAKSFYSGPPVPLPRFTDYRQLSADCEALASASEALQAAS